MTKIVSVSSKGQVVIPQEVRERLGIQPGTKLRLRVSQTHLELSPVPEDLVGHLCGIVKKGPSLSEQLLAEREADRAREEAQIARFPRGLKVPQKRKRI